MKSIEIKGKTVDEAIESGIKELGTQRDKVDIEVLDEGSRGFLGLLGGKPARVRIIRRDEYEEIARKFLDDVLSKMGVDCNVEIKDEQDVLHVNLSGPKMGILIGYRGETLDSLQYLLSLVVNKNDKDNNYKRVILDTENYRKKREETLIRLANRIAYKVGRYNKSITLEPMNPYERRIIHAALQGHSKVVTHSEGEEPYRKVVVELKR